MCVCVYVYVWTIFFSNSGVLQEYYKEEEEEEEDEELELKNSNSKTYLTASPCYWVIQAGLLTPLTFTRHRLSSLAAFTSGAYFLHNGRR